MALSPQEIFEFARKAVGEMFDQQPPDFKFPFDRIWDYIPAGVDIPGRRRPSARNKLVAAGYIAETGQVVRSISEKRASSKGPEYRFGPTLFGIDAATSSSGSSTSDLGEVLSSLRHSMDAEGYIITAPELVNFFLAMTVSPLVILSGISGTGKSLLPRKFANHTKSRFYSVPVQPKWEDNSDLFGYVPTLDPNSFIEGRIIKSLRAAITEPDRLVIVLLDEMNLAPVEHYFSDFLSVTETRTREGRLIVTDCLPIELPKISSGTDAYAELRNVGLPPNLRIVGTANMDETTHSFSPKVLDRAFTIELDDPDLTAFSTISEALPQAFILLSKAIINQDNAISVSEARSDSLESEVLFDEVAQMLTEVQQILAPAGIKFGYRTRDTILLYLHAWLKMDLSNVLDASAALDFCLLQKVLPKISGSGEVLVEVLGRLSAWLAQDRSLDDTSAAESLPTFTGPFGRSLQKVERMLALLQIDGATHYWGT